MSRPLTDGRRCRGSEGDAQASLVWRRMGIRENIWRMPPIASEAVDTEGLAIVRRWIEGLE